MARRKAKAKVKVKKRKYTRRAKTVPSLWTPSSEPVPNPLFAVQRASTCEQNINEACEQLAVARQSMGVLISKTLEQLQFERELLEAAQKLLVRTE